MAPRAKRSLQQRDGFEDDVQENGGGQTVDAVAEQEQADSDKVTTARRDGMAELARRRAAHFAHFQAEEDEEDTDNVHVGGDEACKLGPWSSARQLVEARAAAAQARQDRLRDSKGDEEGATVDWQPSRADWQKRRRVVRQPVPALSRLCVVSVADHIDYVDSLLGLPQLYLTQIAECVAARRKLTPDAWRIFSECGPSEVAISNCTQISENVMVDGLKDACTARLEKLDLHFCGRGFGERSAAVVAAAAPLSTLRWLRLSGAYRLNATDLLSVLRAAPHIERLFVPHCVRLEGPELPLIAQALPGLLELDLSGCGGLDTAALAEALRQLESLEAVSLNEVIGVTDEVLQAVARPALKALHARRCPGVTNAGVAAVASKCPSLRELGLSDTLVSDAALAQVALQCPELAVLDVRKCGRIKSEAALIAIAQAGALQRLDVSVLKAVSGALLLELASACKRTLCTLDISFCRHVTPACVGFLLDSVPDMQELRIYGCSQITRAAVCGHSNQKVIIKGEPTYVEVDKLIDSDDVAVKQPPGVAEAAKAVPASKAAPAPKASCSADLNLSDAPSRSDSDSIEVI